jgi:hypothetical protein
MPLVLRFDVHSKTDPLGPALYENLPCLEGSKKITAQHLDNGSGEFQISRYSDAATSAIIARGNWVMAYNLLLSDTVPVFCFQLEDGDFDVISNDEQGGEILTFGGPGNRSYLKNARIWPDNFMGANPINESRPTSWHWFNDQYGDIWKRLMDEDAARPTPTMPALTYTWSTPLDSAGNAWPSFSGDFYLDIGLTYEEALNLMQDYDDLYVRMTPGFVMQAYKDEYGIDRSSSSFASGKVRFVQGVNIKGELQKSIYGPIKYTHVIVEGAADADGDPTYVTVVAASYVEGQERREGFITHGETNNLTVLAQVGQKLIRTGEKNEDAIAWTGMMLTNSPLSGKYLPGPANTGGHFWEGDYITIHTGATSMDYNNKKVQVMSITYVELDTGDLDYIVEVEGSITAGESGGGGLEPGGEDCCGKPGTAPVPPPATGDPQGNAPLVAVSRSINGPTYDGIGSYDGELFDNWDTGNSSIYHSDAQPKGGSRHHIQIDSICYPLYNAYDGIHQMFAGAKFHVGGSSGEPVGIVTLHSTLTASHGTGWPNYHPRFGPFSIHIYKYLAGSTATDAPALAAMVGTVVGGVPDIGPSTNGTPGVDEKIHYWEGTVDLSDIPYDGTHNFILVWKPLWEVGGYTCLGDLDPEGGFGEINTTGVDGVQIPEGPGWYTGPIGGLEKNGVLATFDVPYGYTEVREVTINGIEMPPTSWEATDGTTITFIGWAPLATDDVQVKRYIPAP